VITWSAVTVDCRDAVDIYPIVPRPSIELVMDVSKRLIKLLLVLLVNAASVEKPEDTVPRRELTPAPPAVCRK
jgi:hypothetical protein